MRLKRRSPCLVMAALVLLLLPSAALAQVAVYAEGAYTATTLDVYIYADITGAPLCSYGVTLYYKTGKLTVGTALKNDAVWYFGTTGDKKDYMNPDTSTAGQVIFIGGKLDTGSPTAGVTGTRVLLGKVSFTRSDSDSPGATPESYFLGTTDLPPLAWGKASPYNNFVTTGGDVIDTSGVAFNTANKVRERGDANGSGSISFADINAVKSWIGNPNAPCYADCNGSGVVNPISVTFADINCVKSKIP